MKTTKYEHVIPQLVEVQEDPDIEGLLIILNTVGGDVEAGLAIAELIRGITKPTASIVLGGGHSIGIPLAVSADRSFIVPTATMTIHPVRHSGTVLAMGQTMSYLESIQDRVTGFVVENSKITKAKFTKFMTASDKLIMDTRTIIDGKTAVKEGLIDSLGGIGDALEYLYSKIERKGT
jgi:ATP-dependent protease ClpP protease subunit